jgi:adenylylsulfate kinase
MGRKITETFSRYNRENFLSQEAKIIWFTGLSGSGKSTLARNLEKRLFDNHRLCYVLDGDSVRKGLNSDLGLSPEDRNENIRRISEVANLLADAGIIVICATISPYAEMRQRAKDSAEVCFLEIYVKCPVEECIERDPKGLYAKQQAGIIKGLTGIDAPYEEPTAPDLILETHNYSIEECVDKILKVMKK